MDKKEIVILVPEDTTEDWSFAENEAKVVKVSRDEWDGVMKLLDVVTVDKGDR